MKMDKKQIPKKPDFTEDKKFALCPCCNGKGLFDKQKYCDDCYACPYEEQCDKSLVAQDTILNNLDEW